MLYSEVHFTIKPRGKHYGYCAAICKAANNLRNATLFRVRQVLTMFNKDKDELTTNELNELEVFNELEKNLPAMGVSFKMPTKGKTRLSYNFLDALLKVSENPDYLCKDLPRQSAQTVIKNVVDSMDSFYALSREFRKNPTAFTGKPNLPKYGKKVCK